MEKVTALKNHIEEMKVAINFSDIEMNLRADLVMTCGLSVEQAAAMSDDEVYAFLDGLDGDEGCDEENHWEHTITCNCGKEVHLTHGMWVNGPLGDGWYWSCPCGDGGFIWEGAFDDYEEFENEN